MTGNSSLKTHALHAICVGAALVLTLYCWPQMAAVFAGSLAARLVLSYTAV